MSGGQSQEFSRAMALIGLAVAAVQEIQQYDNPELADNISTSLRLALELLEADHAAGGIGMERGSAT